MDDIFFWGKAQGHAFLSNFYFAPFVRTGRSWKTVEHWYQAHKTKDFEEEEKIRLLATPKEAKFAGYHVVLIPEWEDVKEQVMLTGLREKFTQNKELRAALLATGDSILHEDSPWDKYWGYVGGKGRDRLGILLMQVRKELRNSE